MESLAEGIWHGAAAALICGAHPGQPANRAPAWRRCSRTLRAAACRPTAVCCSCCCSRPAAWSWRAARWPCCSPRWPSCARAARPTAGAHVSALQSSVSAAVFFSSSSQLLHDLCRLAHQLRGVSQRSRRWQCLPSLGQPAGRAVRVRAKYTCSRSLLDAALCSSAVCVMLLTRGSRALRAVCTARC